TRTDRPLSKPAKIAGEPIEKLLDLLKESEDRVRYRTRIELTGRDTGKVIAAAQKWITSLDNKDADYEHHMLEALWLHQSHNVVNETMNTLERRAGSMVDRKNIAASLLVMIEKGKVPAERQTALLETICRHGDGKELAVVWQHAAKPGDYPPALRKRVLEWLAD